MRPAAVEVSVKAHKAERVSRTIPMGLISFVFMIFMIRRAGQTFGFTVVRSSRIRGASWKHG
jgi:hypothetical protein